MEKGFKIKTLHAFIAEEADGTEGVIGQLLSNGVMMPFVGADPERIKSLYPLAQKIAASTNHNIKLVKFTMREDIEIIKAPAIQ